MGMEAVICYVCIILLRVHWAQHGQTDEDYKEDPRNKQLKVEPQGTEAVEEVVEEEAVKHGMVIDVVRIGKAHQLLHMCWVSLIGWSFYVDITNTWILRCYNIYSACGIWVFDVCCKVEEIASDASSIF